MTLDLCLKQVLTKFIQITGKPGKNYYGRGYIQLTHSYNYKAASLDLYHDLRLIDNPDLVATSEDAAWGTAFWFWKVHVHNRAGVKQVCYYSLHSKD